MGRLKKPKLKWDSVRVGHAGWLSLHPWDDFHGSSAAVSLGNGLVTFHVGGVGAVRSLRRDRLINAGESGWVWEP